MMLLYPYYMGMGFHAGISALLFRGKVSIQNSGWVSPQPFQCFAELANYMKAENHYLHEHIHTIGMLYTYHATNHNKMLNEYAKEVEGRIERLSMMIPCNEDSYLQLKKINFHDSDLSELRNLINYIEFYTIASIDFMFMMYEVSLELKSIKEVCQYLDEKVRCVDKFDDILLECLLHRIISILPVVSCENKESDLLFGDIVTDSRVTANILENIVKESNVLGHSNLNDVDAQIDITAYRLFDGALSFFHEKNDLATPKKLGNVFNKHKESLETLRVKCKTDASEIILNSKNSHYTIENRIKSSLSAYRKEVADILSIKTKIVTESYNKITEDPIVWSALLAGFLSLQAGAPTLLTTSAAIAAASKIGVSALKSKREVQRKLNESPLSVFTHLK